LLLAPSLESAFRTQHFYPESAAFVAALSVIGVVLPSEKTGKTVESSACGENWP